MESQSNQQLVKVRTIDGAEFSVDIEVLKVSQYFADYLEDRQGSDEDLDISDFSIINKEMMEAVIEFSTLVRQTRTPQISKPIQHQSIYEVVSPAFAGYADRFNDDKLAQLILVANTLNNQPLLEVLSAKLAIELSKLSVEKFREYFSINAPFDNDDDLKRIKNENEEALEIYGLNDDDE